MRKILSRRQLLKKAGLSALVLALTRIDKALPAEQRKKWVMLDPGHGMGNKRKDKFDPGCCYGDLREADMNLQLALRTGDFLLKEDIESGYTRVTNDAETPLDYRWQLANTHSAPIFVSIHCDGSKDESVRGIKVYHFPTSEKGRDLATSVYNSLVKQLTDNKIDFKEQGLRTETFRVLKRTNMPAIVIEAGYLSNQQDRTYLTEKRDIPTRAIALGIANYFRER